MYDRRRISQISLRFYMASDWKESGIKRRDERATKISDKPKGSLKAPAKKKDTKRWCRGKEGVEHKAECQAHPVLKAYKELICTSCGKHLDIYHPRYKTTKPDWVK